MKTVMTLLICLLYFNSNILLAQEVKFVTSGVIEYEKSVNMFIVLQKQMTKANEAAYKQLIESYKKSQPQFQTRKSNLSFSKDKTLFEPIADPRYMPYPEVQQNNIIHTDISTGTSVSQKTVYEQTFLVKDIARPIKWKFTNEVREIAGYNCRRANGLMMDSIYVVAFYAEDIPVSGGPESFNGLPGMILGVAVPDEHVTWFATKVEDKPVPLLHSPTKGKVVNNKELKIILETDLKNRGEQMYNLLKAFLL